MNAHPLKFVERQKRSLIKLRNEISEHLGGARVVQDRDVGDAVDRGNDDAQADLDFTISSKDFETVREIDQALDRISRGIYGACEMTGDLIPTERLEVLPFARHTVSAAKQAERRYRLRAQYGIDPERFEDANALAAS